LDKAIENAQNNLGFKNGLPSIQWLPGGMHNEWEITHEEIHRNGAIVAILTIIALPVITLIFLKRTRSFNWYCTSGIKELISLK
jgi:hypothetical protein